MSEAMIFSEADRLKLVSEVFDKDKVVLTCKKHGWAYGSKKPPVFKCKDCQMASFMGLMCVIPADKRMEVLEMLEYSVHKLIEADEKGTLGDIVLNARPEVTIEKG
jgi:hypothetical protein